MLLRVVVGSEYNCIYRNCWDLIHSKMFSFRLALVMARPDVEGSSAFAPILKPVARGVELILSQSKQISPNAVTFHRRQGNNCPCSDPHSPTEGASTLV